MIFVIAGSAQQAAEYMRRRSFGSESAISVVHVRDLQAVRIERPEQVVLVGTWFARGDWPELQSELRRQLGVDALDRLERDL